MDLTSLLPSWGSQSSGQKIEGEVLLRKAYFLDVTDPTATGIDLAFELLGQKISFQLVSSDHVDQATGFGKTSEVAHPSWNPLDGPVTSDVKYRITFKWDSQLGIPGALIIKNNHLREFFLRSVTLKTPGKGTGKLHFQCDSWIYPAINYKIDRVFFANQSYLPSQTPAGLDTLRKRELVSLRGDGKGERQFWERIYDYDVYNDLGEPNSADLRREVLGGSEELPYPRRCRTGRPRVSTDNSFETRSIALINFYVPPDEKFPHTNLSDYRANFVRAFSKKIVPTLKSLFDNEFNSLEEVKSIYSRKIPGAINSVMGLAKDFAPTQLLKGLLNTDDQALILYKRPQVIEGDEFAWRKDEEFARQTLSGLNPMVIKCLVSFPPTSNLDPDIYGPQESTITAEQVEKHLSGLSLKQAIDSKRLFILDYYDAYMPYVERINKLPNKCMYATRTIFFLNDEGVLKPVAIELCLPPTPVREAVRNVYTPAEDDGGEAGGLWLLAKAHARVNDSGYHQLISHWLRTHAVIEPFIIATHRQLSALHPLHKLLVPHFVDTMDINQSARQTLINANGVIELCFTTGKYSIEISAKVYKEWRLNEQGLPADLLKRGIAVEDSSAPHGLRLAIEDYPYAVDGLEIWSALKSWVSDYLSLYYKSDADLTADTELQSWWSEIINVGHGDRRNDEGGWYKTNTVQDLIEAITTIIWVASAHHAAVNFGQYSYGGYMPNLPTVGRKFIPEKHSAEYSEFLKDTDAYFLKIVSDPTQTTTTMAVLELLSKHSTDEVYLGQVQGSTIESTDDDGVEEAFKRFSATLEQVEKNVTARNQNPKLKNRYGPAKVPYTLLYPNTTDLSRTGGLTGRGIPNSISI